MLVSPSVLTKARFLEHPQLDRLKMRAKTRSVSASRRSAVLHRPGRVFALALRGRSRVARAFCRAEPSGVLADIENKERTWSLDATRPGQKHITPVLNSFRASWALVRQWCGQGAAIAARENRIAELEKLVWDAVYALQRARLDQEANRLRRALF
jgi:hypothetical protein